MHDVIRDMALWIAGESEKEKFFVKSGVQLKEQPKAKKCEEVTRMSLMENQIENLTEILECPNLQTLFLGSNDLKVIMDDFFNFMPMLRVLDLSRNMNLKELPVGIAKLVSLEHLNLSFTKIRKLPVELKALAKLKYLNLELTEHLEMIPQQLISSFSKLQVLKMEGCGYGCLLVLEEMEHLKCLNVLTLTFRSASELEKASRFSKFFSCAIENVCIEDFRDSRSLNIMALAKLQHLYDLCLGSCMDLEEVKIERTIIEGAGCFHSLRSVMVDECNNLRDVSWVTFAPHLEALWIDECNGLEEIISEEKLGEVAGLKGNLNLFSKLENLYLSRLPKLKTIYHHALPFPQLKQVYIRGCPMLKKLPLNSHSAKGQRLVITGEEGWWKDVEWEDESSRIAFLPTFKPCIFLRSVILDECNHLRDVSWVAFAPHLEVLRIAECNGLEEIISEEKLGEVAELKGNSNLFSKLEILCLHNLAKLKTIYHHALPFPLLKKIRIVKCGMLKKLPLNSKSTKGQRLVIEGEEGWWKNVEWKDESTRIAFLPSFKPYVI
ncbi:hypothetical protein Gotur_026482 [Gossypium turneri]